LHLYLLMLNNVILRLRILWATLLVLDQNRLLLWLNLLDKLFSWILIMLILLEIIIGLIYFRI